LQNYKRGGRSRTQGFVRGKGKSSPQPDWDRIEGNVQGKANSIINPEKEKEGKRPESVV